MTVLRRTIRAAMIAAVAAAGASAANAQGIGLPTQSGGKPIEIHADQGIEWQSKNKAYIARGNAKAVQGDVSVLADMLTAYYTDDQGGTTSFMRA